MCSTFHSIPILIQLLIKLKKEKKFFKCVAKTGSVLTTIVFNRNRRHIKDIGYLMSG